MLLLLACRVLRSRSRARCRRRRLLLLPLPLHSHVKLLVRVRVRVERWRRATGTTEEGGTHRGARAVEQVERDADEAQREHTLRQRRVDGVVAADVHVERQVDPRQVRLQRRTRMHAIRYDTTNAHKS